MEKWENIVSIAPIIRFFCLDDEALPLNNQKISDYINQDRFIHSLLSTVFQKQSSKLSIESALNSYGIKGLRDRIVSLYVYKLENKTYPEAFRLENIIDIIDFENRFSAFAVGENYRTYILGYFLKVYNEFQFENGLEEFIVPIEVDEILLKGKIRSKRLDWLIITLTLILQHLDKEEVLKELEKEDINIMNLFKIIPNQLQQDSFNFLMHYSHAIGQTDMFTFKRV